MKRILTLLSSLITPLAISHGGLIPLQEHVDVNWNYDSEDGWICEAKTVVGGEDVFQEFDAIYLPIEDKPVSSGGQREIQPDLAAFDFTGVPPGSPIWIAPQIQIPGLCWPGFNNYQSSGVFGSYQETDSRLTPEDQASPFPWIRVAFQGMTYQGSGTPSFSMWQTDSGGTPTVWFSTADTTTPDVFLMVGGSHIHANWGFGAQGIYRIRLSASAFEGPGKTNPTGASAPYTITFAVGPYAQWQAAHFSGVELEDPATSGPEADPDYDGLKNVVEFAFGYHPKNGNALPVAEGLGLPRMSIIAEGGVIYETLDYPRRRVGEQMEPLVYTPQFSPNLGQANWNEAGIIHEVGDFPAPADALNAVWEKVRAKRAVGSIAPPRGFGRVAIEKTAQASME